jgi:uncharacterized protein YggE
LRADAQKNVPDGLSVQGFGQATFTPDVVRVFFQITSRGDDPDRASRGNKDGVRRVVEAVRLAGATQAEPEVKTVGPVPTTEQQGFGGGGFGGGGLGGGGFGEGQRSTPGGPPPSGTSYTVRSQVSATLRRTEDLGKLVAAVSKSNPGSTSGYSYELSPTATARVRREALRRATTDALEKARALGETAGLKASDVALVGVSINPGLDLSFRNHSVPDEQTFYVAISARFSMPAQKLADVPRR